MIVLCPRAFSAADGLSHERDFLKYFLSRTGRKGIVANEVWETFRFRVKKTNNNENLVEKTIAEFRGIFNPEELIVDENHREKEPEKEHDTKVLIEKTRDLLKRRWADIEMFVTTEPDKFNDIENISILSLQEFLLTFMDNDNGRKLLEEFWGKIQREKWE
jgi:hypothetical protein